MTPTDPNIEIVDLSISSDVLKEKLKTQLEKVSDLEKQVKDARAELIDKDAELKQLNNRITKQKLLAEKVKQQDKRTNLLEAQLMVASDKLDLQTQNLTKTAEEVNKQKIEIAVLNEKLKNVKQDRSDDRIRSILASLLFLLSTGLASLGYNLITSNQPNSVGVVLIIIAILVHVAATLIIAINKGGE